VGEHGFEQGECGGGVIAEVLFGMDHGLAGLNKGGKVEDAVKGFSLRFGGGEDIFKLGPVCQISLDKLDAGGQKVAPSMAQVIKNNGLDPIFSQQTRDSTTYVPRTACNQNFHEKTRPSQTHSYSLESNM
jgi:hypothetical protein